MNLNMSHQTLSQMTHPHSSITACQQLKDKFADFPPALYCYSVSNIIKLTICIIFPLPAPQYPVYLPAELLTAIIL